jgi:CTP:molybdopterin cytidylyltransferase MocA
LLSTLTGDAGGRALIYRGLLTAQYLAADTPALATDIDIPAEYAALCAL